MNYVLKGEDGLYRKLEEATRLTYKWERAHSFPTEQAAIDFRNAHPQLKDFAVVPMKVEEPKK